MSDTSAPARATLADLVRMAIDLECWTDEAGDWHPAIDAQPVQYVPTLPRDIKASNVVERCRRYVAKQEPSISGSCGHDSAWHAAQTIARGFALSFADGYPILEEFNNRCQPPWSEKELRHKWEDAAEKSRKPLGYILNRSRPMPGIGDRTPGRDEPAPVGQTTAYLETQEEEPEEQATAADQPEPFPIHCFPPLLRQYAIEVANSCSCPVDFPAVTILSLAGAAIGNSRALSVKRTWKESGRFYIAIVAPPGASKTPTVDLVCQPVFRRQARLSREWQRLKDEYDQQMEIYERAVKKPGGQTGIAKPDPPPNEPHIYTTDATVEVLNPILQASPRGISLIRDEVTGWVLGMNQYKGGKGSDRQFWLTSWSGGASKVDRKGSLATGSVRVPRPFINVLGGIQPDMLEELCDEKAREDGFVHRILFTQPLIKYGAPWTDAEPSEFSEQGWSLVLDNLYGLQLHDDNGDLRPHFVRFTAEGRAAWIEWFNGHREEMRSVSFSASLLGPWAKLEAYCARIALTIHCMRRACEQVCGEPEGLTGTPLIGEDVDETSVRRAAAIISYFKSHMRRVYTQLKTRPEDRTAERTIRWIVKRGGKCFPRDLVAARIVAKSTAASALMKELADRGLGKIAVENFKNGKTAETFIASPHSMKNYA